MNSKALNTVAPFEVAECRVEPSILRVTRTGEHTRLESKAMQVLVYLVEHAGRVVSRGELEEHLWPGRIVTEDAVTNAIAKLRRVFGDDARHPRVIETVPKIGYRLIAQVMQIGDVDEQGGASSISTTHAEGRGWRPSASWIAGAFFVLLLFVGAWAFLSRDEAPHDLTGPLSGKPAVAILPFENLGASPEQDYFANGITADLITDLSKGVKVVSDRTGLRVCLQGQRGRSKTDIRGTGSGLCGVGKCATIRGPITGQCPTHRGER